MLNPDMLFVGACDEDTCQEVYDVADREDHCAECGTCWEHCRKPAEHRMSYVPVMFVGMYVGVMAVWTC